MRAPWATDAAAAPARRAAWRPPRAPIRRHHHRVEIHLGYLRVVVPMASATVVLIARHLAHPAELAARTKDLFESRFRLLSAAALVAIVGGVGLYGADYGGATNVLWAATAAVMLVPLTWSVARTTLQGRLGVDLIALVAIAGALALGEYLAGAALMLAGGNALEAAASTRARRELTALLAGAPRVAHRRIGERIEEVPIDELQAGDFAIVRSGEVVPVDGILVGQRAVLDEATLTGESLPVTYGDDEAVRSGAVNAGAPFEVRAARRASESAYAALVRLVEQAQDERAPFTRLADRYAVLLLPVTLLVAASPG